MDAFKDPSNWSGLARIESTFHPETARGMENDQKNGFMLIADQASGADQWWRVNPETGETLGMARVSEGVAGSVFTEYNIKLVVIALNVLKAFTGYYSCYKSGGGTGCILCHAISASIGIISVGLSSTAGLVAGGADSALGGICNVFA